VALRLDAMVDVNDMAGGAICAAAGGQSNSQSHNLANIHQEQGVNVDDRGGMNGRGGGACFD
jgi:hypothetical protein